MYTPQWMSARYVFGLTFFQQLSLLQMYGWIAIVGKVKKNAICTPHFPSPGPIVVCCASMNLPFTAHQIVRSHSIIGRILQILFSHLSGCVEGNYSEIRA